MKTSIRISSWTGALAAGFLFLISGVAVCDDSGTLVINY